MINKRERERVNPEFAANENFLMNFISNFTKYNCKK